MGAKRTVATEHGLKEDGLKDKGVGKWGRGLPREPEKQLHPPHPNP